MSRTTRDFSAAECGVVIDVEEPTGRRSFPFPADTQSILVGRDSGWAHVVTPESDLSVSGKHMEIRRQIGGEWEVAPLGRNFVAVKGRPVKGTRHLADNDQLALGKAGGLRLKFRLVPPAERKRRIAVTGPQDDVPEWEDEATKLRRRLLMIGGATAVLLACVGALGWFTYGQQSDIARILAEQEKGAARPSSEWSQATIARLQAATHLIVANRDGQEWGVATAWPVAPDRMVTNAHVVAELCGGVSGDVLDGCSKAGLEVLVRSVGDGAKTYRVRSVQVHPGYAALKAALADRRAGTTALDGSFRHLGLPSGYDLALLTLDPDANAGPVLEIATGLENSGQLNGQQIGFAGYLLDGTVEGNVAHVNQAPSLRFGNISAVTSYFLSPSQDHGYLLQNTIPITGGASGGAVIDRNGHVVGVVSSGTVVTIPPGSEEGKSTRAPNAALVNYAQRADLLNAMLGKGEPFDADKAAADWALELDRFTDYRSFALQQFLEEAGKHDQRGYAELQPARTINVARGLQVTPVSVDATQGKTYAVMAYSETAEPVWVRATVGGQTFEARSDAAKLFLAPPSSGKIALEIVTNSRADGAVQLFLYGSR